MIAAFVIVAAQIVTGVQQGGPPRDARPPSQTGTAVIRGRVFAADTGRPLRRARITVSAPELGTDSRQISTSPDGKYEIKDLPAGRYTVTVARSGYLTLRYGQRRPLEQGKPLQVLDRQLVDNVDFTLPRMSLITGRVFDEANEPVSAVQVMAMRTVYFEGRRRLVPAAGFVQTDDAGQYRLLNLNPGTYYVSAQLRETWTVTEGGAPQTLGYATTYFAGTTTATDARRVTVGVGQEASNTDFALIPGRAATITGTAFDSRGTPLAGQSVSLGQESRGPNLNFMFSSNSGSVGADGTFTIKNVAPGEYKLAVGGAIDKGPIKIQERAAVPIVVNGVDVDNVSLVTSQGWNASGQVVVESSSGQPPAFTRVRVQGRLMQPELDPRLPPNADNGRVKDDGTFGVTGLFGPALLRATTPDNLVLKAILHNGRDITDVPVEMRSGEELSQVQVILTDRMTTVSGQLTDANGAPISDGTVIVFADDAQKWMENSRFVRSARPDQEGRYQMKGLPPGEYLAVAVDYVQDGMWNDPEYLDAIRRHAQRFTLGESDARTVGLKITAVDAP